MDKTVLVDTQIQEGKQFLIALDKADLKIQAAFWIYYGMEPTWKFMMASSHPDLNPKNGLMHPYSVVVKVLKTLPQTSSLEGKIEIVDVNHEFIKALSSFVTTGPEIQRIQSSDCVIGGVFFQDLYIYRIDLLVRSKIKKKSLF